MAPSRLEKGILGTFKLFLVAQIVLFLGNLHVHSAHGLVIVNPVLAAVIGTLGVAVLFVYLSLKRLQSGFGRLYLPVALLFSAVFSLVMEDLFLATPLSAHPGSTAEGAWQMFLFLFIPLVLVAWQYGLFAVVLYCLFTTAFDLALLRWIDPFFKVTGMTYVHLLFFRFFSFMVAGYVISRIMQQLRRERRALEEANVRISRYAGTVEQLATSRERNRMARELHDTLAHTLSSLAVQLEAANAVWNTDPDQARRIVERSLGVTRDGLTETRRAIQALKATPVEELGLATAVEELAKEKAERAGMLLDLNLPSASGVKGLPGEVEQCFYRIAQEAIENAVRHSNGRRLVVEITGSASHLAMKIADDGKGFDEKAAEAVHHFGLEGMRDRALLIHGELTIDGRPGRGTHIELSWENRAFMSGKYSQ
jgi:signal transduction histidine kinase